MIKSFTVTDELERKYRFDLVKFKKYNYKSKKAVQLNKNKLKKLPQDQIKQIQEFHLK